MEFNTGIYALQFLGSDKVYVGQSKNIVKRHREHLYKLRKGLHQPKLMAAYNKYGEPALLLLCECKETELDKYEAEAIEIFDAVNNGYNFEKESSFHGPSLKGEQNKKAQYSKEEYIRFFFALYNSTSSIKSIAESLQVNINVLYQINSGRSHSWLKDLYPMEYEALMSRKGTRRFKTSKLGSINLTGPDGLNYCLNVGDSLEAFADKHGLNSAHLGKLIDGGLSQHKGWILNKEV